MNPDRDDAEVDRSARFSGCTPSTLARQLLGKPVTLQGKVIGVVVSAYPEQDHVGLTMEIDGQTFKGRW